MTVTIAADTFETDWKRRCEELQFEHQLDLERIRVHYDHELKEKVTGEDPSLMNGAAYFSLIA